MPREERCILYTPRIEGMRFAKRTGCRVLQPPNDDPAGERIVGIAIEEQAECLIGQIPAAQMEQPLCDAKRQHGCLGRFYALRQSVAFGQTIEDGLRILVEGSEDTFDLPALGETIQSSILGPNPVRQRAARIAAPG